MIDVPDLPCPKSRRNCPHCEATPAGCRGHRFLTGRDCCAECRDGDHDTGRGDPSPPVVPDRGTRRHTPPAHPLALSNGEGA